MKDQKQIKTIGMGSLGKLFGWILGIIFILLGLLLLYRGFESGLIGKLVLPSILFILSGFILLPVFNLVLIKTFKIQFSGWVRLIIFILLIIFAIILTSMAVDPIVAQNMDNQGNFKESVDENSPEAIKQINASISDIIFKDNLLSFNVIVENNGNVKVSFQIIGIIFKDSQDKEVYAVNTSNEEIVNLSPGRTSTAKVKVENWNAGDYTVSANILDLSGNILANTERQFYV
ncbi:MAG: hypothetical protein KKF50_01375 [Nanoarchaeota archaeon]|nr:hypothetical protein [Nanoarchaeota archaeon]